MALQPALLEILACPEDKGPLLYFADEDSLYNPRLKRRYAIRDDIPIMLIDEAETVSDEEHQRLLAKAEADGIKPTFEQGRGGTGRWARPGCWRRSSRGRDGHCGPLRRHAGAGRLAARAGGGGGRRRCRARAPRPRVDRER